MQFLSHLMPCNFPSILSNMFSNNIYCVLLAKYFSSGRLFLSLFDTFTNSRRECNWRPSKQAMWRSSIISLFALNWLLYQSKGNPKARLDFYRKFASRIKVSVCNCYSGYLTNCSLLECYLHFQVKIVPYSSLNLQ